MQLERQNSDLNARERDIVAREASSGGPSREDFQKMARRRFQDPKPVRRGHWWTLLVWKDHFVGAERKRKRERVRLALGTDKVILPHEKGPPVSAPHGLRI